MTEEERKKSKVKKGEIIALFAVIVLGCSIVIPMVMSYWKDAKSGYYLGKGGKALHLGLESDATYYYEEALKVDPKDVNAYIGLAEALCGEFGNYDRAKEILQKAKKVIRDEEDLLRIEEKEKEIDELIRKEAEDRKNLFEENDF